MSAEHFNTVKAYLAEFELDIVEEDTARQLVVVRDEDRGIAALVLDCEDDLLVVEQALFPIGGDSLPVYKWLLQLNRELVHGALALDEAGGLVLFRDTLQLANLDLNELEATINALALALAAHADELIEFARAA